MLPETTSLGLAKERDSSKTEFLGQQIYRWKNLFDIELDKEYEHLVLYVW